MEQGWWKALQRLLDATAFENVGHMRDFEELLERSPPPEKTAEGVLALPGGTPVAPKIVPDEGRLDA